MAWVSCPHARQECIAHLPNWRCSTKAGWATWVFRLPREHDSSFWNRIIISLVSILIHKILNIHKVIMVLEKLVYINKLYYLCINNKNIDRKKLSNKMRLEYIQKLNVAVNIALIAAYIQISWLRSFMSKQCRTHMYLCIKLIIHIYWYQNKSDRSAAD